MPKVRDVIFCDDIRTENNGKLIIIGAYTGHATVGGFPWQSRLSALVMIDEVDGHAKCDIRVATRGGATFFEAQAEMGIDPKVAGVPPLDMIYLPLPSYQVALSAADILVMTISFDGGSTTEVAELHVIKLPSPAISS